MTPVKAGAKRMSREESRAATRLALIESAAIVFAEKGFHGASVEEIAERAGYTRGAFYSNFADKDDVFVALYDHRTRIQIDEISALMKDAASPADFFTSIRGFRTEAPSDSQWLLLENEFRLYAMRNPKTRAKFAKSSRRVRRAFEHAITAQFDALGVALPAPITDLANIVHILGDGILNAHVLEPDEIRAGFFYEAIALLFEAGVALSRSREA